MRTFLRKRSLALRASLHTLTMIRRIAHNRWLLIHIIIYLRVAYGVVARKLRKVLVMRQLPALW